MKRKSTTRLVVSEITGIVTTGVPAFLWFFDDLPAAGAMALYTLEGIAAIFFASASFWLIAPQRDSSHSKTRIQVLRDFWLVAGMLILVLSTFVAVFIFLILKVELDFTSMKYALFVIGAFLIFDFAINLYSLRQASLKEAEFFLSGSMGGMAGLFVAVFLGVFLAAFTRNDWFVVPFIAIKAMIDLGSPIQLFTTKLRAIAQPSKVEI